MTERGGRNDESGHWPVEREHFNVVAAEIDIITGLKYEYDKCPVPKVAVSLLSVPQLGINEEDYYITERFLNLWCLPPATTNLQQRSLISHLRAL